MFSTRNLARWSRNAGLAGAVAAAILAAGAAAPARATTYTYDFSYDASALRCGFFVQTVICADSNTVAPITTAAGDHFVVNVTSALPIQVPGSSTQNSLFVDAFDTAATLGPGAPGGILGSYQMTPTGFVAAPGQPPPLVGPFTQDRTNDYIGFVGYCCGYGVPDSGFSMTGVTADLTVITADPRPIIGYSVGYAYDLASTPSSYADLVGGTATSPLILPSGLIGKITGEIGGAGPSTQFYNSTGMTRASSRRGRACSAQRSGTPSLSSCSIRTAA
jgi:hypothetical protein